jgi:hypothetical protein
MPLIRLPPWELPGHWVGRHPEGGVMNNGGCSEGTLDFNFFVENGLAEFLKPSQWLRTTYEAPYQRYE